MSLINYQHVTYFCFSFCPEHSWQRRDYYDPSEKSIFHSDNEADESAGDSGDELLASDSVPETLEVLRLTAAAGLKDEVSADNSRMELEFGDASSDVLEGMGYGMQLGNAVPAALEAWEL